MSVYSNLYLLSGREGKGKELDLVVLRHVSTANFKDDEESRQTNPNLGTHSGHSCQINPQIQALHQRPRQDSNLRPAD
jgi:hypothetical protein